MCCVLKVSYPHLPWSFCHLSCWHCTCNPWSTCCTCLLVWIWLTHLKEMGGGWIWLYHSSRLQQGSHQVWLFNWASKQPQQVMCLHKPFISSQFVLLLPEQKAVVVSRGVIFSNPGQVICHIPIFQSRDVWGTKETGFEIICKDMLRLMIFPRGENSLPATRKHCSDDTEE